MLVEVFADIPITAGQDATDRALMWEAAAWKFVTEAEANLSGRRAATARTGGCPPLAWLRTCSSIGTRRTLLEAPAWRGGAVAPPDSETALLGP
jgi:hypothetical protein